MSSPNYFEPGSFRVEEAGAPQSRPTEISGGPRGSVQASYQQAPTQLSLDRVRQKAAVNQATFKAISDMGNALLEPYVEQEQQRLFYEGARRQIEGEALADIVDSQPWYSRIFGSSASVQGARKMAELRTVDEVVNGMAGDMDSLRRLSSDEFQNELFRRTDESLTGDAQTDALIQTQILESMQPLVRAHTKEHYAYVQEEMQSQFTQSATANSVQLQQANESLARGILSQDDFEQLRVKVSNSLQPLEGQSEESYWQAISAVGERAMQDSNWQYINLLDDSGVLDAMPTEQRIQFENRRRTYEGQTMQDMALGPMHTQLAQLTAESRAGVISPNEVSRRIAAINASTQRTTGLRRPFIDAGQQTSLLTGNLQGILEEQRRQRERAESRAYDARQKQMEEAQNQRLLLSAMSTGTVGELVAVGAVQDAKAQQQFSSYLERAWASGDQNWTNVVANNYNNGDGYIPKRLATEARRGLYQSSGEDMNPSLLRSLDLYGQMMQTPGGQAAAGDMMGEFAPQMQLMYELTNNNVPADQAYLQAFRNEERPAVTGAARDTVTSLIREKYNPGFLGSTFGGESDISDGAVAQLTPAYAEAMKEYGATALTDQEAMDRVQKQVESKLYVSGRYAINKNAADPKVSALLGVTENESGRLLDETVQRRLRAMGIGDSNNVSIYQSRQGGTTDFTVQAYDDSGEYNVFSIGLEDLEKARDSGIAKQRPGARRNSSTGSFDASSNWSP